MTRPEEPLAVRLRELRAGAELTQKDVARALGISVPLLSSWESGKVTPPQGRLEAYARLFSHDWPPGRGVKPGLPVLNLLSDSERKRYDGLLRELTVLRGGGEPADDLAPHPLRFPPGQAITIVCSELPSERRSAIGYADPQSPDFVESYKYADLDALLALLPQVSALNPANPIKIGIWDELSTDDNTAHLIALGGIDFNQAILRALDEVPISQLGRETDEDTGGFRIREGRGDGREHVREVKPRLDGRRLRADVAQFLRAPNPFNRERTTVTFFGGMYSRGTVGMVRALTEPEFKDRNADYLVRRFGRASTYSIVSRVPILVDEVVVPDWTSAENRLHEWPPA